METLKLDISQQIAYVRDGRQTAAQALLAIERLIGDGCEYVTLDAVLGRGRHEDDSGIDFAAEAEQRNAEKERREGR